MMDYQDRLLHEAASAVFDLYQTGMSMEQVMDAVTAQIEEWVNGYEEGSSELRWKWEQ